MIKEKDSLNLEFWATILGGNNKYLEPDSLEIRTQNSNSLGAIFETQKEVRAAETATVLQTYKQSEVAWTMTNGELNVGILSWNSQEV